MRRHRCRNPYLFVSSASPPALARYPNPSSLRRLSLLPIFLSSCSSLQATYLHTSLLLLPSLDFQCSFRSTSHFQASRKVLLQPLMRLASHYLTTSSTKTPRSYLQLFAESLQASSFRRYKSEFLSVIHSAASADCLCYQSFEVGGKESEDLMTC
jgi:hypothetical protein